MKWFDDEVFELYNFLYICIVLGGFVVVGAVARVQSNIGRGRRMTSVKHRQLREIERRKTLKWMNDEKIISVNN